MENNILSKRINRLPKELQILIYMFNAEHRKKMKEVFDYIHHIQYTCWNCDIYLIDILHRDIRYIGRKILVCCEECQVIAEENLLGVP
jgi:hypothetical protein